jgi:hypothetical protein
MTFVDLTDYHGNPTKIVAEQVIRFRPALSNLSDPPGCTLVDYGTGGIFAEGNIQSVAALFAGVIRLAGLHAPDGTQIFVNADAIAAVVNDDAYAGRSVAVVKPAFANPRNPVRNRFGLLEDVHAAEAALTAAAI